MKNGNRNINTQEIFASSEDISEEDIQREYASLTMAEIVTWMAIAEVDSSTTFRTPEHATSSNY
jgi:hypothetical protein